MKIRWLDVVLIALTILGSITFVRLQSKLEQLHRMQTRIEAAVGKLDITDVGAMHIKSLETGQPWQWAWRIYIPDNAHGYVGYKLGSSGSYGSVGFGTSRQECIARVTLTELPNGSFCVYSQFAGSSSSTTFASREFFEFLIEHRDQLKIELLGEKEVAQLRSGDPAALLMRWSLPDDLAREAEQKFTAPPTKHYVPTILEMMIELK